MNGQWGVISRHKFVVPQIYDDIIDVNIFTGKYEDEKVCFIVKKQSLHGLYIGNNEQVACKYHKIEPYDYEIESYYNTVPDYGWTDRYIKSYKLFQDNSVQLCKIEENGNILMYNGRYDDVETFGHYVIAHKGSNEGLLYDGQIIVKFQKNNISLFFCTHSEDYIAYLSDKRYSDQEIKSVFEHYYCLVGINDKYGVYCGDSQIIAVKYDEITFETFFYEIDDYLPWDTQEGFGFVLRLGDKYGAYVIEESKGWIPCIYDNVDLKKYPRISIVKNGCRFVYDNYEEFAKENRDDIEKFKENEL